MRNDVDIHVFKKHRKYGMNDHKTTILAILNKSS